MKLLPLSTIGRKILMAVTGLLLIGFLCSHLAGNLLLYRGTQDFNLYAHKLVSMGPLLYVAEIILLLLFLLHAVDAIMLLKLEKQARPQNYDIRKTQGKSTLYSGTMIITGLLVLTFVVIHVATLKFNVGGPENKYVTEVAEGAFIPASVENEHAILDLKYRVESFFSNPLWVGFYVIAMAGIGLHLAHALQSAFRTIGMSDRCTLDVMKRISYLLAVVIAGGFASIPLFIFFSNQGGAN